MSIEIRMRPVGMLEGGLPQKEVASILGKIIQTIKRWKKQINNESFHHRSVSMLGRLKFEKCSKIQFIEKESQ